MSFLSQLLGLAKGGDKQPEPEQPDVIPFKAGWPFVVVIQGVRSEFDYTQSHPISALQPLIERKEAKGWKLIGIAPISGMPGHVQIVWARTVSDDKPKPKTA